MTDTDHPELAEFEGETLGDTITNLITEVKRLRAVDCWNELHATHTWVEYNLLRLRNGAITKDKLIELLWDMCNDPAHKAIVDGE